MRCYLITATRDDVVLSKRYASTAADSNKVKGELMSTWDLGKKNVEVEQVEVPLAKAELLEYLNGLMEVQDFGAEVDGGE